MKQELVQSLFALLRSAMGQGELSQEQRSLLTEECLQELYPLSKKHDLAHLVGYALEKNAVEMHSMAEKFNKAQMLAVFRHEQMQYDYSEICRILREAEMDFMPLKGALIRPYYPQPWMRTSCDVDVLIHPEDTQKAVERLEGELWRREGDVNFHDVSLYSPTGTHLELHFNLRENLASLDPLLDRVWEHACPAGEREYGQSDAFLLFHLLAHMSYHFINGGCGVRSVLDLWVLQRALKPDPKVWDALCREAGLMRFRERIFALARHWFDGEEKSEVLVPLEAFLLSGGVFGTVENRVVLDQAKAGGKGKNLWRRVFMPMEKLKAKYPVLQKRPWLAPFYQLLRWGEMLRKGRLGASVKEMKLNSGASRESIQGAEAFLLDLGLMKEDKK